MTKKGKKKKKAIAGSSRSSPVYFILITIAAFTLMMTYVWLNIQVTQTLKNISGLEKEVRLLTTRNQELKAKTARLLRADRITGIARRELGMVFPPPQSITLKAYSNMKGWEKQLHPPGEG